MLCKYCQSELNADSKFCSVCGNPVVLEEPVAPEKVYCSACGFKLKDNSKFCSSCGNPITAEQTPAAAVAAQEYVPGQETVQIQTQPAIRPSNETAKAQMQNAVATPQHQYQDQYQPEVAPETSEKQNPILIFGIIALAAAVSSMLSFLGIIFGAVAMNKAKKYIELTGHSPARVSVGKALGKAGLIAGIVMTVFWTLYIVFFVAIGIITGYATFHYSF